MSHSKAREHYLPENSAANIAVSIVIPVLNERRHLPHFFSHISALLAATQIELIFVDGGSDDGTQDWLIEHHQRVIGAKKGRAQQMNAGAAVARGALLLFLHVDSYWPDAEVACSQLLQLQRQLVASQRSWGRFNLTIAGNSWLFPVIAFCINWRSRITGIATGDQGIFITRTQFEAIGQFPVQPLMEDIELSARLAKDCRPLCLTQKLITSGRRWEQYGVVRTILLMWRLRFDYWRGVSAAQLAARYR